MNRVREEGKPLCEILYKLLKEEYLYDQLIGIYTYPTLIKLKYFIGGIHHCGPVVGKWVFDSNFPLVLHLTKDNLDYFCINNNGTKGINGYKGVLK